MTNPKGKIISTLVTQDSVEILLDNGTKVFLSSNPGYLHVHLSNINLDHNNGGDNISIANQATNQFDVKYQPYKD